MDIDLVSENNDWNQVSCPWNEAENTKEHKCAIKNTSICKFFCGIKYLDSVLFVVYSRNVFGNKEREHGIGQVLYMD